MYATATEAPGAATAIASTGRLFSSTNVGVATFCGSVLAGSIVLGINFLRLGRSRAAIGAMVGGAVATTIIVVAAVLSPDDFPTAVFSAINLGLTFGMKKLADVTQGEALAAHAAAGGRVGAGWATAGITVIALFVVLAAMVPVFFATMTREMGASVTIDKVSVYFKDGVTEPEARKVGEYFRDLGVIDHDIDLQLLRRDDVVHIVFIVEDASSTTGFREIARGVADHVFGGAPVVVDLANDELEVLKSLKADP